MAHSRYRGSETLYSGENKNHKVGWNMYWIPDSGRYYVGINATVKIDYLSVLLTELYSSIKAKRNGYINDE